MDNKFEDIKKILSNYMFNKELVSTMNDGSSLLTDLKINSARIIDIVLDVEEKYNIEINDDELKKIRTISDVINLINNKTD